MVPLEEKSFIPYPIKFHPLLKERVWGGRRLESVLGKSLPLNAPIGESWEISDREDDATVVANGPYSGLSLSVLRREHPSELVGNHGIAAGNGRFPLLIKFIDASEVLSVQVHPNNEYAAAHHPGELGKTEAWYIVHADPDSEIIFGFKPGVDRTALEKAIESGTVKDTLRHLKVKSGDCFFTPAGRAHALGAGIVVYEVQQNSDVTYRFYDWNRLGLDGKPRELHIPQSLDVLDFSEDAEDPRCSPSPLKELSGEVKRFIHCPFFVLDLIEGSAPVEADTGPHGFHAISAISGQAELVCVEPTLGALESGVHHVTITVGETVLLPASLGRYRIEPHGQFKALRSFVPNEPQRV
ncbi:MAG: type I phosphomannose isomerase catalytic subunit [Armatimonadota bacterium]